MCGDKHDLELSIQLPYNHDHNNPSLKDENNIWKHETLKTCFKITYMVGNCSALSIISSQYVIPDVVFWKLVHKLVKIYNLHIKYIHLYTCENNLAK